MSTAIEVEDVTTTRSEKLLAWLLALFLIVAGVWTYAKLDDLTRHHVAKPSVADRAAITHAERAGDRLFRAQRREAASLRAVELARETYRTELDAGHPAPDLRARYAAAQRAYAQARDATAAAKRAQADAAPAANAARTREARAADRRELAAFVSRAAFFGLALVLAYVLLARLRRRGSRYFPVAVAATGAAAVLVLFLAGDYITDYVNPVDYGALLLSLFGAAVTLIAFWALQRYLTQRIPRRRVRKHECPFCGYPVRENPSCEGCGRDVLAECAACHRLRRVGTRFCGACGAA
jgi:hypothetical protein